MMAEIMIIMGLLLTMSGVVTVMYLGLKKEAERMIEEDKEKVITKEEE